MLYVKQVRKKIYAVGYDLELEQSQNRSSIVTGGLTGITENKQEMQSWMIILYILLKKLFILLCYRILQCNLIVQVTLTVRRECVHIEWSQSRIFKDEKYSKHNQLFQYDTCTSLKAMRSAVFIISTLVHLQNNVRHNDCSILKKPGKSVITEYESERLKTKLKTKNVFHPIKKNSISLLRRYSCKKI